MGLFDGQPSAADIAIRFGIPVMALIDAGAMARLSVQSPMASPPIAPNCPLPECWPTALPATVPIAAQ
jgi:hypothetical protein